jgi:hypothetical protein
MPPKRLALALITCVVSIGVAWGLGAADLAGPSVAAALPTLFVSTWVLLVYGFKELVLFCMTLFLVLFVFLGIGWLVSEVVR